MNFSLQDLHLKIKPVIEEANELMLKGFNEGAEIFIKKGAQLSTSTLTQTDKDMSNLLKTRLKKLFPDFGFLTEESKDILSSEEYVWVIDEIDGTANFANHIPIFSTSIALWDMKKNTPLYGVISFPCAKEIIHAIKGDGTYLNNKKVSRKVPKRSHMATAYGHVGSSKEKLKLLEELSKVVPLPENYRCATFHLVSTALGRIDCSVFGNCAIWDFAAGMLICKEAGLEVKFVSKKPNLLESDRKEYNNWFVIAEKPLSEKLAGALKEVYSNS